MQPILTLEEIETRYDGEWVLLADIESDPGPVFRRGRVLWHGTDQDECWATVGVLYVGDWSADIEPVPIL
jgi:hypothetical protein